MTPEEARESLRFHDGSHPDVDDPRWSRGFLGMLRPYHGLREESFHEVMEALRVLANELQGERVDRAVVSALFGVCHFARAWGIHPEGMLRRNGLITEADIERLERWVWTISKIRCSTRSKTSSTSSISRARPHIWSSASDCSPG